MTNEQIADLRDTAASAANGNGMAGVDRYCAVIGYEELTRLLDERRLLLGALALRAFDDSPEARRKAADAIAFAAEPLDIDPVHMP